jgi:hypothetical protein
MALSVLLIVETTKACFPTTQQILRYRYSSSIRMNSCSTSRYGCTFSKLDLLRPFNNTMAIFSLAERLLGQIILTILAAIDS